MDVLNIFKIANMEKLDILKRRLDKIGIDVEFAANYPWIYIWKINGKRVKETFEAIMDSRLDSYLYAETNLSILQT